MTLPILVLADDLTGAADSAAAFGPIADTWVAFAGDELPAGDLVAVDTNSRHLPPETAARIVGDVAAATSGVRLYKKIDSTLRGNVAAEVGAVLNSAHSSFAVVAPAFPATGRTTVDGVVRAHGQRLSAAHQGDLCAILRAGGLNVSTIDLRAVRSGPETLAERWNAQVEGGVRALVCDAETDDDLRTIRRAADLLPHPPVLVGSAGLLRVAVDDFAAHAGKPATTPIPDKGGSSTLFVTGSATELNGVQVRELRDQGGIAVVESRVPFGAREQAEALNQARSALPSQDVLLVPDLTEPVRAERSEAVERSLAAVAGRLLTESRALLAAAVLSGGATARAILDASRVRQLSIKREIEAGVVLSTVPALDDLLVVTKSGSFGNRGTLRRVRQALRHRGEVAVDSGRPTG